MSSILHYLKLCNFIFFKKEIFPFFFYFDIVAIKKTFKSEGLVVMEYLV